MNAGTLLAALATTTCVWLLVRPHPVPARVRGLRHGPVAAPGPPASTRLAGRVGHLVRVRLLRRPRDDAADRRAGALVAVLAGTALIDPLLSVLAGAAWLLHGRTRRLRQRRGGPRRRAVETDLPELVDLLALTTAAGLTVPDSLRAAAPSAPPALRDTLRTAVDAIGVGGRVESAVLHLAERWGEPARPLVHALVDHLRYGTPLLPALERVGTEARNRRRRSAEARARKLPVVLLFPLVLCTLPAFGLLTVAPLVAGTLGSLEGSPLEAPASPAP